MNSKGKNNPTALIIDDTELMRELIKAMLEQLEYQVIGEAENGRVGIDLAIELEPELILLDVMMPEMNGYLALEEIIGRCHDPFVVMLSSVDDEEVVQECMLAGAQGYIVKSKTETIPERLTKYRDSVIKKRNRR